MIFLYPCVLMGKEMLKKETSSPVWSGTGYFILGFSALPKPLFCFQCLSMRVYVMCMFCMYVGECACGHPRVMNHHPLPVYLIYWGRLSQSNPKLSNMVDLWCQFAQWTACLCILGWEGQCHHVFYLGFWGSELWSSCLGRHFNCWVRASPLIT